MKWFFGLSVVLFAFIVTGCSDETPNLDTKFTYSVSVQRIPKTNTIIAIHPIRELPGIGLGFLNRGYSGPPELTMYTPHAQSALVLLSDGLKVGDRVKVELYESSSFRFALTDRPTAVMWWARKIDHK
jgi:hypothetical protein